MMTTTIKEAMKDAMRSKDSTRLTVMRGLMAAFTNELVAKGLKPQDKLPDEDCIAVIRRLAKQRKDSIEQFEKGGRADLSAVEKVELAILETYLPQMISKDEIRKVATAKQAELGMTDKSKMGMLMGAVMKELKGKADGGDVKEVVEGLFN